MTLYDVSFGGWFSWVALSFFTDNSHFSIAISSQIEMYFNNKNNLTYLILNVSGLHTNLGQNRQLMEILIEILV